MKGNVWCLKCGSMSIEDLGAVVIRSCAGVPIKDGLCRDCATWVAKKVRPTVDDQVFEFHEKFNQPNRDVPQIISDDETKLRVRIVMEEAIEFAEACYPDSAHVGAIREAHSNFLVHFESARTDLVKAADALADIDYVVAGTRWYFGFGQQDLALEVHQANMRKDGGGKDGQGKVRKPVGWVGPDIDGVLRKQGWKG